MSADEDDKNRHKSHLKVRKMDPRGVEDSVEVRNAQSRARCHLKADSPKNDINLLEPVGSAGGIGGWLRKKSAKCPEESNTDDFQKASKTSGITSDH